MMSGIEEVTVNTLGELLDKTTPTTCDAASGRRRDCAIYRGLDDSRYHLLTSIDRLGGVNPPHSKVHLEGDILRNFVRYSRPHLTRQPEKEWEYIVVAQHHGLPTRLLDWTYSPLVAAHFATVHGSAGVDRVVWRLDWIAMHQHFGLPPVAILDFDEVLGKCGYASVWDYCDASATDPFVCMLEPPHLDTRIAVQSAAFTIASSKTQALDELLMGCGLQSAVKRFVIPGDKVDYIRDQLDLSSVDERRLFPDLDGVAQEMTRYYSTSPA